MALYYCSQGSYGDAHENQDQTQGLPKALNFFLINQQTWWDVYW